MQAYTLISYKIKKVAKCFMLNSNSTESLIKKLNLNYTLFLICNFALENDIYRKLEQETLLFYT